MKITTLFICVLFSVASATPKFIDWSWSSPSLDFLEQNLEHMKAECPFLDGIVVKVTGKQIEKDGKKWGPVTGNAWGRTPWQFELFDENIARFKKLDFGNFTDNFFYMTTTYADFEWDSDDDFAVVAANFGVAAMVARAIGLKGLGVDIEEYGKKYWNFSNHKTDKTFDEYCEIVFRRGQQWGRAVFAEYPDIVLLMPFCISSEFLELAIPFMNGIIDVMPPTAIIFEGHEASGYIAKIPSDYKEMQLFIRRIIRQKIRPENISKATGQIRLAPAFYMDAYFNDAEDKNWYVRQLEPERSELSPLRLLSRNLAAASLEADPYIWIYGEQACW